MSVFPPTAVPAPSPSCTTPCRGDSSQLCGGTHTVSIVVAGKIAMIYHDMIFHAAECEPGWSRLGDICLQSHPSTHLSYGEAADTCAVSDSSVWWPSNDIETQYVAAHMWSVVRILVSILLISRISGTVKGCVICSWD